MKTDLPPSPTLPFPLAPPLTTPPPTPSLPRTSTAPTTRRDRIIYWTTTGFICAVMLFSAINFAFGEPIGPEVYRVEGAFAHLHLPAYFKYELTIAKLLGVLALLVPGIPASARRFAYAGFAITLASASIAHFSVGDSAMFIVDPLVFLAVLGVSFRYFQKLLRSRPQSSS